MIKKPLIPKFILFFFIADITLVLLYLLSWELGQPFQELLNLDGEKNIPAWYSSIQLFLVACLWAVFATVHFDKKNKKSWFLWITSFLFVFLSMDEIIGFHEWVVLKSGIFYSSGKLSGGGFRDGVIYLPGGEPISQLVLITMGVLLLVIPFLLLMSGLFIALKQYLKNKSSVIKKYWIGVFMLIASAIGLDTISSFFPQTEINFIISQCFEELGEMIAVTFFLWATYDLLLSYNFSLRKAFGSNLY